VASRAKGTLFKGPFHLPRMLWYGERLCREMQQAGLPGQGTA
jgi:hypothetical protein